MKLLATSNLVTLHGSIATMDDGETQLRVLDESFRIALVFGGAIVFLFAVLALAIYVCLLVSELQKGRR